MSMNRALRCAILIFTFLNDKGCVETMVANATRPIQKDIKDMKTEPTFLFGHRLWKQNLKIGIFVLVSLALV